MPVDWYLVKNIFYRTIDFIQLVMTITSVVYLIDFIDNEESYFSKSLEYSLSMALILFFIAGLMYFALNLQYHSLADASITYGIKKREEIYFMAHVLLTVAIIAEILAAILTMVLMNAEDEVRDRLNTEHFVMFIILLVAIIGIRCALVVFSVILNCGNVRTDIIGDSLIELQELPDAGGERIGEPESTGDSGNPEDSAGQEEAQGPENPEEEKNQSHQNTDFKKLPSPDRRRAIKCPSGPRASKDQSPSSERESSYFSQESGERVAEVRIEDEQVFFQKEDSRPPASVC